MLKEIHQLLIEIDQPSLLLEGDDQEPYDRLLVTLEAPQKGESNVLTITEFPQFLKEVAQQEWEDHLLQFQFILPVEISPHTFNQVSSSLHFFNRLLHCPGFELDELNSQIVYRYCWFINQKGLTPLLLQGVIGNLKLCYHLFLPYIKEIAQGKYTLEDILQQVLALTKKNPI